MKTLGAALFVIVLVVAVALMISRSSRRTEPELPASAETHGNFKLLTRYHFPDIAFDYGDVAVADFDGDVALDLALSGSRSSHLEGPCCRGRGSERAAAAQPGSLMGATQRASPRCAR